MSKIKLLFTIVLSMFIVSNVHSESNFEYDTPVVANETIVSEKIAYEDLYGIFTLSVTKWENGQKVRVVMMSHDNFAHKYFIENYLGIGRSAYSRRLENAIASGRSAPPIEVVGNEEMIKKLSRINGAIGYLDGVEYTSVARDNSIIILKVM